MSDAAEALAQAEIAGSGIDSAMVSFIRGHSL